MEKNLGGVGTLLVLGLGLGLLRGNPAPPHASSEGRVKRPIAEDVRNPNPPSDCRQPECLEKDLLDAVASSSLAQRSDDQPDLIRNFQKSIQGSDASFAIAIAPDPLHTHLSLFFDRTMDAIQVTTRGLAHRPWPGWFLAGRDPRRRQL